MSDFLANKVQDRAYTSSYAQVSSLNQQGASILDMVQKTGLDEKAISNYLGVSIAPNPYPPVVSDTVEISDYARLSALDKQGSSILEMMLRTGLDEKTITGYLGL